MRRKITNKRVKISALLFIVCMLFGSTGSFGTLQASAADPASAFEGWVWEDAGLLTEDEEEMLEQKCKEISGRHHTGVYIITTEDFGGVDIKDWQRQVFEEYGLGADYSGSGVMLAVSMAERDWGLVSFGTAQEAFSTYGRERIGELILEDLSDGEYYDAFAGYLSLADEYLTAAEEGKPYTENHRYGEGWRIPVIIAAAFILSLAGSLVVVLSWKKSMNTRVRQSGAMAYLKEDSFRLYNQTDQFLYHRVSRTMRPKESSSGSSGMHSDHSGTSGKF